MTNLEKFEDKIKTIIYSGDNFAVEKDGNEEPVLCNDINCVDCKFYCDDDCSKAKRKWLKEEYIEPNNNIKLPKDIKTGTPIWVKNEIARYWMIRIFYKYCDKGVLCFSNGCYDCERTTTWECAKPFVEGVNPNED